MAKIAGALPGGALCASAASNMSSQARADEKREAKEARDREREKRQTWKQYEQSRRESLYAQLRDAAEKDLQVHTCRGCGMAQLDADMIKSLGLQSLHVSESDHRL